MSVNLFFILANKVTCADAFHFTGHRTVPNPNGTVRHGKHVILLNTATTTKKIVSHQDRPEKIICKQANPFSAPQTVLEGFK